VECYFISIRQNQFNGLSRGLLAFLSLTLATVSFNTASAQERRETYNAQSPEWLRAVGRLQVPSRKFNAGHARHYIENCSATLVRRGHSQSANTIVTAWHCLEFYSDLSRTIHFTLPRATTPDLQYSARILASGGAMHSDWALLRLDRSISTSDSPGIQLATELLQEEAPIFMAGYSRDSGLGDTGKNLTYDANCKIDSHSTRLGETDCQAYKGASGGAVVSIGDDGHPQLYGIISAGDSESLSRFIPVYALRNAIQIHLP
jgi:Trypsin